jgi:hypothetical protein
VGAYALRVEVFIKKGVWRPVAGPIVSNYALNRINCQSVSTLCNFVLGGADR